MVWFFPIASSNLECLSDILSHPHYPFENLISEKLLINESPADFFQLFF